MTLAPATDPLLKLCPRAEVAARAHDLPRPLVFTNGVFDLVHRGHVTLLAAARRLGASLLVAVNSDASARRLDKGPGRPVVAEADRALVIAALESVSLVTLFDEDKPLALLAELRPDVYVKGGDYRIEELEEARAVASWGGRSFALPFERGCSSSEIVRRIVEAAR